MAKVVRNSFLNMKNVLDPIPKEWIQTHKKFRGIFKNNYFDKKRKLTSIFQKKIKIDQHFTEFYFILSFLCYIINCIIYNHVTQFDYVTYNRVTQFIV